MPRAQCPAPAAPTAAVVTRQANPKQISTLRAACRSDFMSHRSGVQPRSREAMLCLDNKADISQRCQGALAIPGALATGAPRQVPGPQHQRHARHRNCCRAGAYACARSSRSCASARSILATCAAASGPAVAASLAASLAMRLSCGRNVELRWSMHGADGQERHRAPHKGAEVGRAPSLILIGAAVPIGALTSLQ
jgi:hypothetical protein